MADKIMIYTELVDNVSKKLTGVTQEFNKFGQATKRVTTTTQAFAKGMPKVTRATIQNTKLIDKANLAQSTFGQVMGMNLQNWRQYNAMGGKFKTIGGQAANKFRMMTHGLRGFRMEMLGVMFFGMGLSKFFSGLLQPALKLVGIFELWSLMLSIVFLPLALALLDPLLKIMDWFINLPEPVKMGIGVFVALAAILFKLLFLVGMFALGLGSLIQAFGGIAAIKGILTGVGTIIGTVGGFILAILAVITIAIIGFVLAWKENFGKIKGWVELMWVGIKQIFKGFIEWFKGLWMIISGLFEGNTDKIIKGLKLMAKGFKNIFVGLLRFVGGLLVTLGLSILRALWGIVKSIGGLIVKAYSYLKGKVTGLVGGGGVKGGRQIGGFIPHTGLYRLHAGEHVIPTNQTYNSSPTINVYGVSNEDLIRRISDAVTRDLASLARR
jgi:hypothetical protein